MTIDSDESSLVTLFCPSSNLHVETIWWKEVVWEIIEAQGVFSYGSLGDPHILQPAAGTLLKRKGQTGTKLP